VAQKTVKNNQDSVIILNGHWVWGPNINRITTEAYIGYWFNLAFHYRHSCDRYDLKITTNKLLHKQINLGKYPVVCRTHAIYDSTCEQAGL
jgi:hypothetical protein